MRSAARPSSRFATVFRSLVRRECSRELYYATRAFGLSVKPSVCVSRMLTPNSRIGTIGANWSPYPSRTVTVATRPTTRLWLESKGRVVFRYVGGPGDADEWWSPNGSMNAIAGIVNAAGNVLGMMPHPERAVDDLLGSSDGMGIFESILSRVAA